MGDGLMNWRNGDILTILDAVNAYSDKLMLLCFQIMKHSKNCIFSRCIAVSYPEP